MLAVQPVSLPHTTPTTEQSYADFDNVAWDNDTTSTEENFPTAPLDDEVWSEDQIPDRPLCIYESPHKSTCSVPNHVLTAPQPSEWTYHSLHHRVVY